MENIKLGNLNISVCFMQCIIIPNTNNKNGSRKSYIRHSCCWQIVLPNMFMCKLLHAVLPLRSTKLSIVVIIFRTLSVSTIWMLSGVRGWNFVYGRTAFVILSLGMKCSYLRERWCLVQYSWFCYINVFS